MLKISGRESQLEGREFFAEFFDPTDKLGADVPNPKSHVAYGFATHVVVLDDDGRVKAVSYTHLLHQHPRAHLQCHGKRSFY